MATVSQTRMTADAATAALVEVEAQITRHAEGCTQCRAARYGVGLYIWRACELGRDLEREQLALIHRVHYLAVRAQRRVRQANSK